MSWIPLKKSWKQSLLVGSFSEFIPESRNVEWSGFEEWNSEKVGFLREMTTSAGSWRLIPQDQSLMKCSQNSLLEGLINGTFTSHPGIVAPQTVNFCAPAGGPQVATVWNWCHLHRLGRSGSSRRDYFGQDYLNWCTSPSAGTMANYPHTLTDVYCIPTKCQIICYIVELQQTRKKCNNYPQVIYNIIQGRILPRIVNITVHPRICLPSVSQEANFIAIKIKSKTSSSKSIYE